MEACGGGVVVCGGGVVVCSGVCVCVSRGLSLPDGFGLRHAGFVQEALGHQSNINNIFLRWLSLVSFLLIVWRQQLCLSSAVFI